MTFPYNLIDLSHTLEPKMPAWDSDCGFRQSLLSDYADGETDVKFRVMQLAMPAGIGTHLDAPSHCIPFARNIDELDINELCMPCVVVDVSDKADAEYRVTRADLAHFEQQHGPIAKGSCVLIYTGWSRYWQDRDRYLNQHVFPSVSIEAAQWLVDRDVAALGIDTLSPDRPDDGYPVHQAFLGSGKLLLENVANLEAMPPIGAMVLALALKIKQGTEAPMRLVGLIPSVFSQSTCYCER